jgi:outer membrane protein assembly factor BamE
MRFTTLPASDSLRRRCSRLLPSLALASVVGLGSGCLYLMPVQQGNFLDPAQVVQLETGMTRSQVMFLLGTPMVPNGFNTDRWDYYYYVKFNRRIPSDTKRLTVYFKDDKVERIERTDNTGPAPSPPAQPATAAAATEPATP